jgi:hypothetical protein
VQKLSQSTSRIEKLKSDGKAMGSPKVSLFPYLHCKQTHTCRYKWFDYPVLPFAAVGSTVRGLGVALLGAATMVLVLFPFRDDCMTLSD